MRKKTALILTIALVLILSLSACTGTPKEQITKALEATDYTKVVEIYNENIDEIANDQDVYAAINSRIDNAIENWSSEQATYEETAGMLEAFSELNNDELVPKAESTLEFICLEQKGNELYEKAEANYTNGRYLNAMKCVMKMDEAYSLKDSAKVLYDDAKAAYIMKISNPSSVEEYKSNLQKIEDFLEKYSDEELENEKQRLEEELEVFKKTIKIIEKADGYYNDGKYRKAFETLSDGIKKYPSDRHLTEKNEELGSLYIIYIAEKVKPLVDEESYKEAIAIIENAQSIYPCEAFEQLEDDIRDKRNILHKIGSAIVDKCTVFAAGWEAEVLEVKNEGAGAYIEKSGERILLGDYSDEEVTILSTAGNLGIALAGWDLPLDARDLVYDVQHWGEEEYFVIHLATDAIALVPVVGAVKYAKWMKKANMTNDLVQVGLKESKCIVDSALGVNKHYNYVRTTNQHLKNKRHPKTGVKFIEKKVAYSNGTKIRPVVPKFDYVVQFKLPDHLLNAERKEHNEWVNKELLNKVETDAKYRNKFTEEQIEDLKNGQTPRGLTWHHSEEEGVVQLVKSDIHSKTGHTGGNKLWGADSVRNENVD